MSISRHPGHQQGEFGKLLPAKDHIFSMRPKATLIAANRTHQQHRFGQQLLIHINGG